MPSKNSKRKQHARRRRNKSTVVMLGRSPIAASALVKLRYCDTISINPASGGITGSHLFRLNSLFDPDATGAGHQPLGFDQYSGFYDKYCVLGARINVKSMNTSTTIPLIYGIVMRTLEPGLAVDPNLLREQGDSTWGYAGNASNRTQQTISKNFSAKKFFGYPDPKNETDLRASTTANPVVGGYFQVWSAAANGIDDPLAMSFQVTIDYICLFTKPHALAQS